MGSHQRDEKTKGIMTDWAMPVCVNLYTLTAQLSKTARKKLVYAWVIPSQQFEPSLSDSTLFAGPQHWQHSQGWAVGRRCFWPLPAEKEAPESAAKWKRKLLLGEQAFVLLSSHMFRWDQGQRDMFQFQSCSCESLITTRTGERPWIYSHAACFRNWTPNKDRETRRVPK